jgi:hypothetical protein
MRAFAGGRRRPGFIQAASIVAESRKVERAGGKLVEQEGPADDHPNWVKVRSASTRCSNFDRSGVRRPSSLRSAGWVLVTDTESETQPRGLGFQLRRYCSG